MSTIRQLMERVETLRMKRDLLDAIKGWLNKNFTGNTGVGGRIIPAEVIDEILVDIDVTLLAAVNEEIESLETTEVQNGKSTKGSTKRPKPKKGKKP